jgi:hypothetical protein
LVETFTLRGPCYAGKTQRIVCCDRLGPVRVRGAWWIDAVSVKTHRSARGGAAAVRGRAA